MCWWRDYPSVEVMSLDNHSTDGTVEWWKRIIRLWSSYRWRKTLALGLEQGFRIMQKRWKHSRAGRWQLSENSALSIGITRMVPRTAMRHPCDAGLQPAPANCSKPPLLRKKQHDIYRLRRDPPSWHFEENRNVWGRFFFLYAHETEFAMRVIDQGFTVLYWTQSCRTTYQLSHT